MFKDAIMHVCHIYRVVILQARGDMMLVGVGGSGQVTFSIEITKNYRLLEFRDDIKNLYMLAACESKRVIFLSNDTQVKGEGFLEDINNILSSR
eukprot:gene34738-44925_t